MNGQYARGKVFDLTHYSGNAHQNRGEMPPHTETENSGVDKEVGSWSPCAWRVGGGGVNSTGPAANSVPAPQTSRHGTATWPNDSASGAHPTVWKAGNRSAPPRSQKLRCGSDLRVCQFMDGHVRCGPSTPWDAISLAGHLPPRGQTWRALGAVG